MDSCTQCEAYRKQIRELKEKNTELVQRLAIKHSKNESKSNKKLKKSIIDLDK